jgi:hypothetical protein
MQKREVVAVDLAESLQPVLVLGHVHAGPQRLDVAQQDAGEVGVDALDEFAYLLGHLLSRPVASVRAVVEVPEGIRLVEGNEAHRPARLLDAPHRAHGVSQAARAFHAYAADRGRLQRA